MANVVGRLAAVLTANTQAFDKGFKRAGGRVSAFSDRVKSALTSVQAQVAGLVGAGGFAAMIKNSFSEVDEIGKFAQRIGASTAELSQLGFVAEQTGSSQQTLNIALQRMTRRVSQAAQGSGEAVKALDELGLSAESLAQLRPEQQFIRISEAMKGLDNESDKVRLTFALFDSEGVALKNTLAQGEDGIRAMMQEADRLGRTIDESMVAKAELANDSFNRLKSVVKGLANSAAQDMAPALTTLSDMFVTGASSAAEFGVQSTQSLSMFAKAIKGVLEFIDLMALGWKRIIALIAEVRLLNAHFFGQDMTNQEINDLLKKIDAFQDALVEKGLAEQFQEGLDRNIAAAIENQKKLEERLNRPAVVAPVIDQGGVEGVAKAMGGSALSGSNVSNPALERGSAAAFEAIRKNNFSLMEKSVADQAKINQKKLEIQKGMKKELEEISAEVGKLHAVEVNF